MKKIGIIVFATENNGGIFQYAQSMIDALKQDKTNQYILFCNSNDRRFDNYELEIRRYNVKNTSIVSKVARLILLICNIRSSYLVPSEDIELFNDIDIFLSPIITSYPHFYMNKPYIFTLHDMQERYYPEFFSFKERAIRYIFNKTLSSNAHKIICESNFVKNDIVKFTGVNEEKISVIQSPPPENFLNYEFESEQFEKVKTKYDLPEKFIFYPAQCWFHKNHIKLIEAFKIVSKKYDNVYLIFTGSQQNNYNNLMARIDELNLNDKVKHLGYIDYEDLPYFYKMSQFLVMPTLFESVSIPIYEAFALEVAVCSSNVVALPEQVGNAGLIFDPKNIKDMAEKMMMYLSDEDLRQEKVRLGFEKVSGFNHEVYSKKLTEMLNG